MEKDSWDFTSYKNLIDPDHLFLPREELLAGNESEEQTAINDYPFPGEHDKNNNVQPSKVKNSIWNRDRSKDGDKEPKEITDKDYKKPVDSDELALLKEKKLNESDPDLDQQLALQVHQLVQEGYSEEDAVMKISVQEGYPEEWIIEAYWAYYVDGVNEEDERLTETIVSKEDLLVAYDSEADGVASFEELGNLSSEEEKEPDLFLEARSDVSEYFSTKPKYPAYPDYLNWALNKKIKAPAGRDTFKRYLKANLVKEPLEIEEEPSLESTEFIKDMEGTGGRVEEIFKNVIDLSTRIAERNSFPPHHGFVYGSPGIGKSYTVIRTIEDICEAVAGLEKWKVLKGSTTSAALYKLLWKYRDGWVIIFDDNDTVLSDANAVNYLKAAMDPDQPRIVSKSTARNLESDSSEKLKEYLTESFGIFKEEENEEDFSEEDADFVEAELTRKKREKELRDERSSYWIDHVDPDIDPARDFREESKYKTPAEFQFSSRIIFISNLPNLPPALADRVEPGEVNLSNYEVLDRIEQIMDKLLDKEHKLLSLPDKGLSLKREVLDYLRNAVKAAEESKVFSIEAPITFRLFAKCVAYRFLYPEVWKKRTLKALKSGAVK